jgi:hypothetical protein
MVLKPVASVPDPSAFTVSGVVTRIREALWSLPDYRKGGNNQHYVIGDAGLSAFSVFFMQSPSFLDDQRRMQKERGRNNASTLFGVHQIPSTQQIGNLLDPIAPAHLAPVFFDLVEVMHQHGALAPDRSADGRVLIALDGTEYHDSASIHCVIGAVGRVVVGDDGLERGLLFLRRFLIFGLLLRQVFLDLLHGAWPEWPRPRPCGPGVRRPWVGLCPPA